ncbi:MAG: hypothetical protein U1E70_07285 [Acetobacteraceae bacterium]
MGRIVLLATTCLAGFLLARATAPAEPEPPPPQEAADVAEVTRNFLLNFVMPLWLAAGFADWICHKATSIETTTGRKESLIHLLMLTEAAIPVLAGMFLEVTSPVLALMIASFLLHDMTALWDVSYAVTKRNVTPVEQHVHSYLEMVPLMAVAFICTLHWPKVLELFGTGGRKPDWSIRLKRRPLPWRSVIPLLGAMLAFEWAPYLEELRRTQEARAHRLAS